MNQKLENCRELAHIDEQSWQEGLQIVGKDEQPINEFSSDMLQDEWFPVVVRWSKAGPPVDPIT